MAVASLNIGDGSMRSGVSMPTVSALIKHRTDQLENDNVRTWNFPAVINSCTNLTKGGTLQPYDSDSPLFRSLLFPLLSRLVRRA